MRNLLNIALLAAFFFSAGYTAKAQSHEPDTIFDEEFLEDELDSMMEPLDDLSGLDDFYELPSYQDFYFDSTLIPCNHWYGNIWDTIVIDPYDADPSNLEESFMLTLQEGDACHFSAPCTGEVTSGFGFRNLRRSYRFHFGIDLRLATGDPVFSAFDGVVRVSKFSYDFGYVVVIRHYNGFETLYAHFSKLLVLPGQTVKAGDIIGLGGNTGRSTGAHLHFEVRFMGKAIDPNRIISFQDHKLVTNKVLIDKTCFNHIAEAKKYKYAAKKKGRVHVVRKGETLTHIAYRYGTSVARLCQLNRIKRTTPLRAGRKIRVR